MTDVPEVPRRKGLTKGQISWCREWIRHEGAPIFAIMEKASKEIRLRARRPEARGEGEEVKPDPIAKRVDMVTDAVEALWKGAHQRRMFTKDEQDRLIETWGIIETMLNSEGRLLRG